MKRKSFFAGLFALVLTFSLVIGAFIGMPAKANAASTSYDKLAIDAAGNAVPTVVDYGSEISVAEFTGMTVTVTAPNGDVKTPDANGKVKADQLGFYTVKVATANGTYYNYNIECKLDSDPVLVVANDASIPTYVKKGDKKTLPDAVVGYYDEDGNFVASTASTVAIKVVGATIEGKECTFGTSGSAFVTYEAKYENGEKWLSKTYEVKVQDDFADTKAPTLSVSGVPSSANVNMEVTLPAATATDSFDENVQVVVTVKGKDASGNLVDVKKVSVNDEGIATGELTDNEVFDNADNMSFYPVREGDYKVVYQAIDDNGNKSAEWSYTITCSDKKAPVFTVMEEAIPANWGWSEVVKADESKLETETDLAIKFPFPASYDNKDLAKDVILSFSIKDPENTSIVHFTNINKASGEAGTKFNAPYIGEQAFCATDEYYSFNIAKYVSGIKADNTKSDYRYEGDYVVTYSAQDAAGNKSTKTYTVAVTESYEENGKVNVEFKNVIKKIVVDANAATEFTVPTPTYSSTTDSKLVLVYAISNGTTEIEVEAGAEGEIIYKDSKYFLVVDGAELEINAGKLVLKATAVSDAGNIATAEEKEIKVIVPDYTTSLIGGVLVSLTEGTEFNKAGEYNLGSVMFTATDAADYKNVGVEVGVRNEEGEYLGNVTAEVIYTNSAKGYGTFVKDIVAKTNKSGNYFLEVKVYDVSGNNSVTVVPFVIKADGNDYGTTTSANVTSAKVNEKFTLANDSLTGVNQALLPNADHIAVLAHVINGGKFAIMGEEFTALCTGTYTIQDKAYVVDATDLYNPVFVSEIAELAKEKATVTITEDSEFKFELQGVMPTYSALNAEVALPKATAYTANGNADSVEVEVKFNGKKVKLSADNKFKTTDNGVYTVIYTVKNGNNTDTFEYEIKSGDVVAPVFKLVDANGADASHELSVKSGYTFNFLAIAVEGDEAGDLTYTKKVIGPDGEVVGGTINGTGTTYANKTTPSSGEFTLDASGKYTVRYEVSDKAGNTSVKEVEITVTSSSGNKGISLAALSTILIIVGVLLIAGVVVYLFRFRKVKKN